MEYVDIACFYINAYYVINANSCATYEKYKSLFINNVWSFTFLLFYTFGSLIWIIPYPSNKIYKESIDLLPFSILSFQFCFNKCLPVSLL